jgi:ABC-type nitrate/sulfonate/bicarbonate transport system ATPase subunit
MFQRDLLLPWKTILENTTLVARVAAPKPRGRRARAWLGTSLCERAQSLLAEFGLGEYLDALPHELSGGMRQRVALARTLLLGRNLVLLDEPFAGLDALTRADLQDWMRGVMERHLATWILVTHDIHEAVFLADRVAIMGMHPARVVGWVNDAGDRRWAAEEVKQLLAKAR